MSGRISWSNIDAPDFTQASRMQEASSAALKAATDSLSAIGNEQASIAQNNYNRQLDNDVSALMYAAAGNTLEQNKAMQDANFDWDGYMERNGINPTHTYAKNLFKKAQAQVMNEQAADLPEPYKANIKSFKGYDASGNEVAYTVDANDPDAVPEQVGGAKKPDAKTSGNKTSAKNSTITKFEDGVYVDYLQNEDGSETRLGRSKDQGDYDWTPKQFETNEEKINFNNSVVNGSGRFLAEISDIKGEDQSGIELKANQLVHNFFGTSSEHSAAMLAYEKLETEATYSNLPSTTDLSDNDIKFARKGIPDVGAPMYEKVRWVRGKEKGAMYDNALREWKEDRVRNRQKINGKEYQDELKAFKEKAWAEIDASVDKKWLDAGFAADGNRIANKQQKDLGLSADSKITISYGDLNSGAMDEQFGF